MFIQLAIRTLLESQFDKRLEYKIGKFFQQVPPKVAITFFYFYVLFK